MNYNTHTLTKIIPFLFQIKNSKRKPFSGPSRKRSRGLSAEDAYNRYVLDEDKAPWKAAKLAMFQAKMKLAKKKKNLKEKKRKNRRKVGQNQVE